MFLLLCMAWEPGVPRAATPDSRPVDLDCGNVTLPEAVSARLLIQRLLALREPAPAPAGRLPKDVVTWHFFPDGTFRRRVRSDTVEEAVGAWSIAATSTLAGVLFTAEVPERHGAMRRSSLPIQLSAAPPTLGSLPLRTHEEAGDGAVGVPPSAHAIVECPAVEDHFPLWAAVTAGPWKRASAKPASYPARLRLWRSGKLDAEPHPGCRVAGSWSLVNSDGTRAELVLSLPAHECAAGAPQPAVLRRLPVTRRGSRIHLHTHPYDPVERNEVTTP